MVAKGRGHKYIVHTGKCLFDCLVDHFSLKWNRERSSELVHIQMAIIAMGLISRGNGIHDREYLLVHL